MKFQYLSVLLLAAIVACSDRGPAPHAATPATSDNAAAETADEFVARANAEYGELWKETSAADWVMATYITKDTQMLSSTAAERYAAWHSGIVKEAMRYDGMELAPTTQRAIDKLKLGISKPAPDDPAKRRELAQIASQLEGDYGAGKYCKSESDCKSLPELEDILAQSRDYDELLDAWRGWRTISPQMRKPYARFVELANEGAREFGYENLARCGAPATTCRPQTFEAETERLWQQVKPLYDELHCYVRAQAATKYGDKVPAGRRRSPRTCSATCGRRSGATSIRWSSRIPAQPRPRRHADAREARSTTRRTW